jgi:hypothetical protein
MENNDYELYWDGQVIIRKTITANRPDTLTYDMKTMQVCLNDVAVPLTGNIQNPIRKNNKYANLAHKIKDMQRLEKVVIKPIAISATGRLSYALIQHPEEL